MIIRLASILAMALVCAVLYTTAALGGTPKTVNVTNVQRVICIVFRSHCHEALNVARCESHFSIWARNGQYLGIFQMGSRERAIYGHGNNVWAQVLAAHRYFLVAGWRPWQCRPW